tara:strand:+ start:301 stop:627 length:327 start_codon:yes stop_codon:yes gene_type:complete
LIAALAIVKNPWFGRGFFENLRPEIQDVCPEIGALLTGMILDVTGDALEGYGKASVVGMGGRNRARAGVDPFTVVWQLAPRCGEGQNLSGVQQHPRCGGLPFDDSTDG